MKQSISMTQKRSKTSILITGAQGQLGQCIANVGRDYSWFRFLYASKDDLDITDFDSLKTYFQSHHIDYVINCAAMTSVDLAEKDDLNYQVNVTGVKNLVLLCKKFSARLIHLSTDYVFNGLKSTPYQEQDAVAPINNYGRAKQLAEDIILNSGVEAIIIRTSWLFSPYGQNFVKVIVSLLSERRQLLINNTQIGCPTYGIDLANFIMKVVSNPHQVTHKIYHFANQGSTTWFEFGKKIIELMGMSSKVSVVPAKKNQNLAKRPEYSVLDTSRIKEDFKFEPINWKIALAKCVKLLPNVS